MKRAFQPGDEFRGYTIRRLLGRGGIGSVWLACRGEHAEPFAVKILDRDVARQKPEYVKRFVREAKLVSEISHPNLVAVHDSGYDEAYDVYFIVMDYVMGDTLRPAIALGGPHPMPEAAGIVLQIAGVLDAAQRLGLVHRDLKPENIMVAPDGTVRLLDLGVAKVSKNRIDSFHTMAASVFGTPGYIAPEQAVDSSSVDVRADIYSLGVILFELLSGRRPYEGGSLPQALRQLLSDDPIPDVREFAPSVSPELAGIVAKMCAKKAEDRYATPAELIDALTAAGFSAPTPSAASGASAAGDCESIGDLLAAAENAGGGQSLSTLADLALSTDDPDMLEFLRRRSRRRKLRKVVVASAAAVAVAAALVLLLLVFWPNGI